MNTLFGCISLKTATFIVAIFEIIVTLVWGTLPLVIHADEDPADHMITIALDLGIIVSAFIGMNGAM